MNRLHALLTGVHAMLATLEERGGDEFSAQHVKLCKTNIEEALACLEASPATAPSSLDDHLVELGLRVTAAIGEIPDPVKRAIANAVIEALAPYRQGS